MDDEEAHVGAGEGVPLHHLQGAAELGLPGFQELAPSGDVEKSDRTSIEVPRGRAYGSATRTRPPSIDTRWPSPGRSAVVSSTRATAAMEHRASPRKPRVATRSRSSKLADLRGRMLVEGEEGIVPPHAAAVVGDRDPRRPPPSSSTRTSVAPASRAFSTSSLTTDAGRSTTSPAAIWETR